MAWGDLASNQMVSYTDAQGGGFTLKPGQSSVTSNQCMTKDNAFTKYYLLSSSSTNALASNQLMQKSFWAAATLLPYSYTFYYASADGDPNWGGFNTSSEACAATSFSATVYSSSSSIVVGMELFYDQYGTIPLNCTSYDQSGYNYYKINSTLIQFVNEGFFGGNVVYSTSICVVNSVVFSSLYSYTGSSSASYSGTVTITGASATFNARSTSTGNFSTDTNINIGGNARRARQITTGTLNSTTFTLTPGTYSYTFSCQVTGGGTGIGQIIFTQ